MSGYGQRLSQFRQSQTDLYNEIAPNVIPTKGPAVVPTGIQAAVGSYDPYNKRVVNQFPNIDKYFVSPSVNDEIKGKMEMCANSTLDNLIETQDPRAPTCGWLYRSPPTEYSPFPRYSKGVLVTGGSVPPPPMFNRPPGTTLYTDLQAAKKVIDTETCRALRSCDGVDREPYAGRCGFSLWKGYGIPVNSDGTAKYNDDRFFTPAAQIVRTAAKCPAPEDDDDNAAGGMADSANVCKQLPNKSLSRDCILQQIRNAGCDNKGTLYKSLAESQNPSNYASKLQGTRAYSTYQTRMMSANKPILSESLLRSGAGTQADAMNTFSHLYEAAVNESDKTAAGVAARDLCLNAGEIDQFDFCSELVDSTPMVGVELDCLQKEFRRRGGTPSGELYPRNNASMTMFVKWGDYRKFLDKLFADMDSSDMQVRAVAFKRAMGVQLVNENNIIPAVRGKFGGCQMTTEVGLDRSGNDIQLLRFPDYESCQKACCDNPSCNAFTHVKDGSSGLCFLKRGATKATPHWLGQSITSGYKQ
jgi:hypothetical protein